MEALAIISAVPVTPPHQPARATCESSRQPRARKLSRDLRAARLAKNRRHQAADSWQPILEALPVVWVAPEPQRGSLSLW